MPILMPSDTQEILGEDAKGCKCRSLFMHRFANPSAKDRDRKKWFEDLVSKQPERIQRRPLGNNQEQIYAQVQSRLMVNTAGGVMENAGLCLDWFGLPYIPGSAIKGCARRMAVQHLVEASTAQVKSNLLVQIALAFGWGEQDWSAAKKDGRFKSDFAYAVGNELWASVAPDVRKRLPKTDHFAGAVSFLPAHAVDASGAELPLRPPPLGTLDLDVVTCHHPDYYAGKVDRSGRILRPIATDDEDPNPVIFPAIAAGHVFVFVLLPLTRCSDGLLALARQWLEGGLSSFGLGAKTAAGYGWFDCSDEIQRSVRATIARREKQEAERRQQETEAAALKAKQEAEHKQREQDKATLESLTRDQQQDYKVARLTADQFRSALDNFSKRTPEEQGAIVRSLRLPAETAGSRRGVWEDLKAKAQKRGGKLAQTEQNIRQLSKQMYPGKDGKMP